MANIPRRSLFQIATAAALSRMALAQQNPNPAQPPAPGQMPGRGMMPGQMPGQGPGQGRGMGRNTGRGGGMGANTEPFPGLDRRATVALMKGDDRRKNRGHGADHLRRSGRRAAKGRKFVGEGLGGGTEDAHGADGEKNRRRRGLSGC